MTYIVHFAPETSDYDESFETPSVQMIGTKLSALQAQHKDTSILVTLETTYTTIAGKIVASQRQEKIKNQLLAAGIADTHITVKPPVATGAEDVDTEPRTATLQILSDASCK